MADGAESRELTSQYAGILWQEGQCLHHQAADQDIKDIFAPFVAEDWLIFIMRVQAFDGDKNQAGEKHVEREPVEAEVNR